MRAVPDDFAEAPTLPPQVQGDSVKGRAKATGGPATTPEVDTEAETLSDDDHAVKLNPDGTDAGKPLIDGKPGIPHDSIATADTGPTKKP